MTKQIVYVTGSSAKVIFDIDAVVRYEVALDREKVVALLDDKKFLNHMWKLTEYYDNEKSIESLQEKGDAIEMIRGTK